MVIGIIGGGASGMAAAISAAENKENQIILFERQARLGRKLLATGNGRCNLTNLHANGECYHGDAPEFAKAALGRYPVADTLEWFRSLGLYTVYEDSGRVYPYSDQANSVLDVLRFALEQKNIQVLTGCEVSRVRKTGQGFSVETAQGSYTCDRLIVACGGLAGSKLGGTMDGYKILRNLGHRCTKLRPTLVQLKSGWHGCPSLKGVRANCAVTILRDGSVHSESVGEIQFTEYGLSGPVIFETSRDVCFGGGEWSCRLDFLPELGDKRLLLMLQQRGSLPVEELFTGILHNRLGRVMTASAGIRGGRMIGELTQQELEDAVKTVKGFVLSITEPMGMDSAQVTAGGIVTGDFAPETMESRILPGLYACGEVLDIDGDCGGYNLQWAWSSGRLAGATAGGLL